jgi:hypothetical protein
MTSTPRRLGVSSSAVKRSGSSDEDARLDLMRGRSALSEETISNRIFGGDRKASARGVAVVAITEVLKGSE